MGAYIHGARSADFTVYYCIVMPQGYTTLSRDSLDSLGPVIMGVYIHNNTLFCIATYSLYNVHDKAPLGIVKPLYLLP